MTDTPFDIVEETDDVTTAEDPPEAIFELIRKPLEFPRWWGSVYLKAERVGESRVRFQTKGKLPYTLLWDSETIESRPPESLTVRATGDLDGRGIWTLGKHGASTDVTFDWKLTAEKPLLRYLSFLLRPLFAWNHRWVGNSLYPDPRRDSLRQRQHQRSAGVGFLLA